MLLFSFVRSHADDSVNAFHLSSSDLEDREESNQAVGRVSVAIQSQEGSKDRGVYSGAIRV